MCPSLAGHYTLHNTRATHNPLPGQPDRHQPPGWDQICLINEEKQEAGGKEGRWECWKEGRRGVKRYLEVLYRDQLAGASRRVSQHNTLHRLSRPLLSSTYLTCYWPGLPSPSTTGHFAQLIGTRLVRLILIIKLILIIASVRYYHYSLLSTPRKIIPSKQSLIFMKNYKNLEMEIYILVEEANI